MLTSLMVVIQYREEGLSPPLYICKYMLKFYGLFGLNMELTVYNMTHEILEDYDHDHIEELDCNFRNMDQLDQELKQLMDSTLAIEQFGMTQTAFSVLKTTGLLSGTALNTPGLEFFATRSVDNLESDMALEALGDKIKQKMTEWAAKIISVAKGMTDTVTSILSTLWNKVSEQGKMLTSAVWDKAKVAGATIKAHPYKTLAAMVAAAAVVVAIIALVATGMPGAYANETVLQSFIFKIKDMISGIKLPFGKINVTTLADGTKIVCNIEKSSKMTAGIGKLTDLGWTQSTVKAMSGSLSRVWSTLKINAAAISNKVVSSIKTVNDVGGDMEKKIGMTVASKTRSKLSGWIAQEVVKKAYTTALWSIIGVLYMLLKEIVIKTFKMIDDTFRSLKKVTKEA